MRFVFAVPDGAEPKTLRMRVNGMENATHFSHPYVYDLTPPPAPANP